MTLTYLIADLPNFVRDFIWHMPDGFATLVGAIVVLLAAGLAYVGVELDPVTNFSGAQGISTGNKSSPNGFVFRADDLCPACLPNFLRH
jgi:hypothetical protein